MRAERVSGLESPSEFLQLQADARWEMSTPQWGGRMTQGGCHLVQVHAH